MSAFVSRERARIPRDRENDYARAAGARRAVLIRERTGLSFEHVTSYSVNCPSARPSSPRGGSRRTTCTAAADPERRP